MQVRRHSMKVDLPNLLREMQSELQSQKRKDWEDVADHSIKSFFSSESLGNPSSYSLVSLLSVKKKQGLLTFSRSSRKNQLLMVKNLHKRKRSCSRTTLPFPVPDIACLCCRNRWFLLQKVCYYKLIIIWGNIYFYLIGINSITSFLR